MHLVTGASSGIGRGVAAALAERGETVVATARDAERLRGLSDGTGSSLTTVAADLTTPGGVAAVVTAVDGPVASVVHAAASRIPLGSWRTLGSDELLEHLDVHVAMPITLTRTLLDRGPVARMIIIDSFAATTPRIGWSAYAIAKAAAQMSARAAAQELDDTLVARVFPGAVETPLLRQVLDGDADIPAAALYQAIEADGRVSDPADVGREIARIILDVPDAELIATETWHVGHSVDPGPRNR